MAYVILKNNNYQVSKIISGNDMQYHGNKWDNTNHYIKIEITEQEFLDIKNNVKIIDQTSANSVTLVDTPSKTSFEDLASLKAYVEFLIGNWTSFVNEHNENHGYMTRAKAYLNYLKNIDYSGFSFPMNNSFENYLNSINQPFLLINELP